MGFPRRNRGSPRADPLTPKQAGFLETADGSAGSRPPIRMREIAAIAAAGVHFFEQHRRTSGRQFQRAERPFLPTTLLIRQDKSVLSTTSLGAPQAHVLTWHAACVVVGAGAEGIAGECDRR